MAERVYQSFIKLWRGTSAQRDAATSVDGDMLDNTTTNRVEIKRNGAFAPSGKHYATRIYSAQTFK
jgi:hypothetical protein